MSQNPIISNWRIEGLHSIGLPLNIRSIMILAPHLCIPTCLLKDTPSLVEVALLSLNSAWWMTRAPIVRPDDVVISSQWDLLHKEPPIVIILPAFKSCLGSVHRHPPRPCLHCQPLSAPTLTLPWYKPWQQNPTAMLVCHEFCVAQWGHWSTNHCIITLWFEGGSAAYSPTSCLLFIIQLYERTGRVRNALVLTNSSESILQVKTIKNRKNSFEWRVFWVHTCCLTLDGQCTHIGLLAAPVACNKFASNSSKNHCSRHSS